MTDYRTELPALTRETATGAHREVIEEGIRRVGREVNMYANMAHSPGLLRTYLEGYERFREASGFSPIEQEVVFLTISRHNECTYCMAAHSVVADTMSGVPAEVTDAIRSDSTIPDSKLETLASFTRTLLGTRGRPSVAEAERFLAAGYRQEHMLEIILAIAVKTLSNYSNRLFQTPVDEMFASRTWSRPVPIPA